MFCGCGRMPLVLEPMNSCIKMYIDRYEKWDEEKWQCEKRKRKWNWNENKYLVIKMYTIFVGFRLHWCSCLRERLRLRMTKKKSIWAIRCPPTGIGKIESNKLPTISFELFRMNWMQMNPFPYCVPWMATVTKSYFVECLFAFYLFWVLNICILQYSAQLQQQQHQRCH